MHNLLIVSNENDAHARVVAWSLRQAGHEVTFWDTGSTTGGAELTISDFGNQGARVSFQGVSDFHAGWLRRVFPMRNFPAGVAKEDHAYISGESRRAFDSVMQLLDRKGEMKWINGRDACIDGEIKLRQLDACGRLGIKIPATIVSNSPREIRKFAASMGEIVVKPLDVFTWENDDGSRLMTYAATVTAEQMKNISDEELALAPVMYQQLIRKNLDIRAVHVGGETYCCEISNPNINSIDFRPHQTDGSLTVAPHEASADLRHSLDRLADYFQIQLASSDFCIDMDGQTYFLDLNPGGAFLFVEYNGGGPITSKLASLIGGGTVANYPGLHEYNAHCEAELRVLNV